MLNASKHHAARAALFVLSGKWVQVAGLLALSALLTGCSFLTGAAAGPVEAAIVDGVLVGAAAIDWMLANNVLPPDMAADLGAWFAQTNDALDVAQRGVVEVRENSITIEQAQYGAGGIVAGLLGVVRAWRGGASKGLVAATAGALRGVLAAGKTQPVAKAPPTE
tara:strand:- start:10659 stop:11153 length:495 start_codon:yes stop_codon:yes gene_type:complete